MDTPLVIFCRDPLNPRRTDGHFGEEARAARAAGLRVALLDHDTLLGGRAAEAVSAVPPDAGAAWYRGWMIPAERYAQLAGALAARGVSLLTSPESYRRAHELPGWYGTFASLTPRSVWLPAEPGAAPAAGPLAAAAASLGDGPGIVKDFVKSRKSDWDTACYVPSLSDTARLSAVVGRFVELQEEFLAGGVVLRAFERFRPCGEARVWWVDGVPALTTAHPDSPGLLPPQPSLAAVRTAVAALGCRFVTTDLALREDGAWRVVEVGDGQVSDLPRGGGPGGAAGGAGRGRVKPVTACRPGELAPARLVSSRRRRLPGPSGCPVAGGARPPGCQR
ncbi:ATP-grasp domain-containing protein [Streptomyces orinoci]|uniref:ATP-grasp domain-containing protein n=1 Tax=Streptomyces orinoci TaxID=67339 RepID=A0ABV3JSK7_STRON|nr:ATP-grasp domain-containing protein [Streptomyces orinoci]